MDSRQLFITVADERVRLPEAHDVASLFADDRSGHTTVLTGSRKHAKEWHEYCVSSLGGPAPPTEWVNYHYIRSASVMLYRQLSGHYSPATGAIVTRDGETLSDSVAEVKYVTQDLSGLPGASLKQGRVALTLPKHERRLGKVIVTMPWGGIHNYGHFVLDCLSAVALLATMKELAQHQFVFPTLKTWQIRHLELLGIAPVQCGDDWYEADEIVYTSCMDHFLHSPNINWRTLVSQQMRRLRANSGTAVPRLYIARRGSEKRHFVSQKLFQKRLAAAGFGSIFPEDHSIDQQIAAFHAADIIVGCSGAAMANTIYCRPGTLVVEIQPSLARGIWVRNICALMGLRWRPYFCAAIPAPVPFVVEGLERADIGISFDVDGDDFLSFLERAQS
jgi:capsular polysaccharide biosynthesis protein